MGKGCATRPKRVIATNNDKIGVQAMRLALCEEALRKLAQ
jgi:hypothetical protein